MKASSTKKRRLAALEQSRGGAAAASGSRRRAAQAAAAAAAAAAAPAAAAAGTQQPDAAEVPQPPYLPLAASPTLAALPASVLARLRLPPPAACSGDVGDVLERLMAPAHMPPPVARTTIASRLAPDKAVVLDNPAAKLNLRRARGAARAQRPRLAARLLPRGQRAALTALPSCGLDQPALLALHELWAKYAGGLLAGARGDEAAGRLLAAADWHGALLRVTRCANPIYRQRAGIVAKATANALVLASADGRTSTVPLKGSAFQASVAFGGPGGPERRVELQGPRLSALQCVLLPAEAGGQAAAG